MVVSATLLSLARGGLPASTACRALMAANGYEAALPHCTRAFGIGDPAAGLAAAQANFALGRLGDVRTWSHRLQSTAEEGRARVLAARSDIRARQLDRARTEYLQALQLLRAAGDHATASAASYGLFWIAWSQSDYKEALLRC